MAEGLGFLGAIIAIFGWGLSKAPMKTPAVKNSGTDMFVFQIYNSATIFIVSWLALIFVDFKFTPWGILGGAIWVPGSVLANYAIKYLGLAIAQGTWAGTTMIISFLWGVGFGEEPKSAGMTVLAFIFIIVGITGVSRARLLHYYKKFPAPAIKLPDSPKLDRSTSTVDSINSLSSSSSSESSDVEETDSTDEVKIDIEEKNQEEIAAAKWKKKKDKIIGFVLAIAMGFLNASIFVPTKFVPEDVRGIPYIVSYGIGIGIVTPVYAFVWFVVVLRKVPEFNFKIVAWPAFVSGVINTIGNAGSIVSTDLLGLTVGYPLTQLSLLVAGVYGMVVYGEIGGLQPRLQYFFAALILLGGAVLLALFG